MKPIALEDLTVARRHGFVLGPLSLTFPAGTRTVLIGPSGAGKTTLLRCVAGLLRPTAGAVRIGDRLVSSPTALVAPHERRIGFVFQSGALWPHLSAVQHLRFCAPELDDAAARDLLARVGLRELADRRPAQLSGGEAQRLALARALAGDPEILLLDEPLRSVDAHLRGALSVLVREISDDRRLTTITVTHDRAEALALGEHVVVLAGGALVEAAATGDLLRHPTTALGAALLAGAACLPATDTGNGLVRTPFGDLPRPAAGGPLALVVLPGEAELAGADSGVRARVLEVEPTALGPSARLELAGHSLQVGCDASARPGDIVHVRLRAGPRLLPLGGGGAS